MGRKKPLPCRACGKAFVTMGYWTRIPNEMMRRPSYGPTGAVIFESEPAVAGTVRALSLTQNDRGWNVIPDVQALKYEHTTNLVDGIEQRFVVFEGQKRTVYACQPVLEVIQETEAARDFAPLRSFFAGRSPKADRYVIVVTLEPLPPRNPMKEARRRARVYQRIGKLLTKPFRDKLVL